MTELAFREFGPARALLLGNLQELGGGWMMERTVEAKPIDIQQLRVGDLVGWFIERIRETRRRRESWDYVPEEDPAATIYLAGLLHQQLWAPWAALLDQHGERLDMDVARRAGKAETVRRRMEIYRAAADRYLLHLGLWGALQGRQQGRYYQITEANLADRACAYYGFAADLAMRLPKPSLHNARVFGELSENFGTYLGILLSLRGDVFNLRPVLTAGEEFHLLRNLELAA